MAREGREDDEKKDHGEHPHVEDAADLSGRAAETVGRRYDGTQEAYDHHTRQEGRDEDDEA